MLFFVFAIYEQYFNFNIKNSRLHQKGFGVIFEYWLWIKNLITARLVVVSQLVNINFKVVVNFRNRRNSYHDEK